MSVTTVRAPVVLEPVSQAVTVPAEVGDVRVRIVRPPDAAGALPVILLRDEGEAYAARSTAPDSKPRLPRREGGLAVAATASPRTRRNSPTSCLEEMMSTPPGDNAFLREIEFEVREQLALAETIESAKEATVLPSGEAVARLTGATPLTADEVGSLWPHGTPLWLDIFTLGNPITDLRRGQE